MRDARRQAGLTYRDMAARAVFSPVTFSRAATGERIPRLPVVEAYAQICGAPVDEARRLWRSARHAEYRQVHPDSSGSGRGLNASRPALIREPAEMMTALQALYIKAGAMPIKEMERRAGGHGRLPHSTVHRMLRGRSMLGMDQLASLLQVCEVPLVERREWCRAWNRAWRRRSLCVPGANRSPVGYVSSG
ncbi:helix-turn-helix domain-containing protein [Streptomyces nojiriensis]|uniref:helix-turn-helix domain-containing protein n=1 Tax=Streptomyces nojiriensis TaxID=66374 RepID=UPI0036D963C1